ncbi:hypothetical protein LCY76_19725 [Fictibacillus sp. KIGAM418]|uniref:Uncharacterized protein n=1 Tax=Fictibacillus marinisediminis TaxID=2878389 RepID=A0A9X1XDQ3_9BACL|nr:hypothetical protein [Fictibacillus marinisediminis]MCK6258801.1 hypothetical protein [Fictibacillus marinisediminis]
MKKRYSKGEHDFIKGCTKAILQNNGELYHSLYDVNGIKRYVTHKKT